MRNRRKERKKRIRLMDLLKLDDEQIQKSLKGKSIESFITPTLKKAEGKPTKPINLLAMNGAEWLRLLAEADLGQFDAYCESCRVPYLLRGAGQEIKRQCPWCDGSLLSLDATFWKKIDVRIRKAIRKDQFLVPRVKSEWESLWHGLQNKPKQMPAFPSSLSWLKGLWEEAPRPIGGPLDVKKRYGIANWYRDFKGLGLTNGEIIDVMSGPGFPEGPVKIGRKDYADIPGQDLWKLGESFRQFVGAAPDPADLNRIMRWVNRQRKTPLARLRGEKVREKSKIPAN